MSKELSTKAALELVEHLDYKPQCVGEAVANDIEYSEWMQYLLPHLYKLGVKSGVDFKASIGLYGRDYEAKRSIFKIKWVALTPKGQKYLYTLLTALARTLPDKTIEVKEPNELVKASRASS